MITRLQHTSPWQSVCASSGDLQNQVSPRLARPRVPKDPGKIAGCCHIFCRGQDCCFLGPSRPSANLIPVPGTRPPRRRSPARRLRQGGPGARRWRPTSVPALLARAWGAAGKPARLPGSLELRVGILINKRECQCAPGASRFRGADTSPGGGASFNPCHSLTFPKLEIPEPQPLSR